MVLRRLLRGPAPPAGSRAHTALCWICHTFFADATTNLFCRDYKRFVSDDLMKQQRARIIKDKILTNFEPCIGETVQAHHTDGALENQPSFPAPSTIQPPSRPLPELGLGARSVTRILPTPPCPSQHIKKCNIVIHSHTKLSDSSKEASQ